MTLDELKVKHMEAIVARSQLKDQVEGIERQLVALGFAISNYEQELEKEAADE